MEDDLCLPSDVVFREALTDGSATAQIKAILSIGARILSILGTIVSRLPAWHSIQSLFTECIYASWTSFIRWASFLKLIGAPFWDVMVAVLSEIAPIFTYSCDEIWRWQTSRSKRFLQGEVAVITTVYLAFLLRRYLEKKRVVVRAQAWYRKKRNRVTSAFRSLIAAVEVKSKWLARILPHLIYILGICLAVWLAPSKIAAFSEAGGWDLITVAYPAACTVYLLLQVEALPPEPPSQKPPPPKRGERNKVRRSSYEDDPVALAADLSKMLLYWVSIGVLHCVSYLVGVLPGGRLLAPSWWRLSDQFETCLLLCALWLHLPGRMSGITAITAPLSRGLVRLIKSDSGNGLMDKLRSTLAMLVPLRILSPKQAATIADNVADSWLLLPVPLLVFSPGFIVRAVCVYTGLLVPAINSAVTLERDKAEADDPHSSARLRWLTYWCVCGVYWYARTQLFGIMRWVPFAFHCELAFLIWLQMPYFHGGSYVFGFFIRRPLNARNKHAAITAPADSTIVVPPTTLTINGELATAELVEPALTSDNLAIYTPASVDTTTDTGSAMEFNIQSASAPTTRRRSRRLSKGSDKSR